MLGAAPRHSVFGGGGVGRGRAGGKGCLALEEELKSLESAGRRPVFGGDRGRGRRLAPPSIRWGLEGWGTMLGVDQRLERVKGGGGNALRLGGGEGRKMNRKDRGFSSMNTN
jgi:hypothetical protein